MESLKYLFSWEEKKKIQETFKVYSNNKEVEKERKLFIFLTQYCKPFHRQGGKGREGGREERYEMDGGTRGQQFVIDDFSDEMAAI